MPECCWPGIAVGAGARIWWLQCPSVSRAVQLSPAAAAVAAFGNGTVLPPCDPLRGVLRHLRAGGGCSAVLRAKQRVLGAGGPALRLTEPFVSRNEKKMQSV